MSIDKATVEVRLIKETFDDWLDKSHIDSELREQLTKANLWIAPEEPRNGVERPFFYEGTLDTFNFLKDNSSEEVKVDLAVKDDEYVELALHFDYAMLGTFVVENVILPIAVNLIYDAIKDRLGPKTASTVVKVKLRVLLHEEVDLSDRLSVQLEYEGTAENLKEVLLQSYEASAELKAEGETTRKHLEFPSKW